jgi:non-specific serine/threonine protein kinase
MDLAMISPDDVRWALERFRRGEPLDGSPLLALASPRQRLVGSGRIVTADTIQLALWDYLESLVRRALSDAETARPGAWAGYQARPPRDRIAADFAVDDPDRQAWSCLFHRYFTSPPLRIHELAEIAQPTARDPRRQIHRRMTHGYELLAGRIREDEAAAVQRSPTAASLSMTSRPPGILPRPITSFVGGRRAVEELAALIGRHRLVTLVGTPGVGKTRLALEASRALAPEFADGAWFVDLAPVADAGQVARTVARRLAVPDRPGSTVIETLSEHLADRHLLLVLDNAEHVAAAVAELMQQLLVACPELHAAVTSRELLHVTGEHAWHVDPLEVPPPAPKQDEVESLAAYSSVVLFTERVQAVRPGFRLQARNAADVAEACRRLDGVPLAIELAAAWANVLSVRQISTRLDHALALLVRGKAGPRSEPTLRQALDRSYALLDQPGRELLAQLSVFAGSFDLDAVDAICSPVPAPAAGAPAGGLGAAGRLSTLVDRSLVAVTEGLSGRRYRLLETIRQYAAERLEATDTLAAVRTQHARYFAQLAKSAAPGAIGDDDQSARLRRLATEHDNLRRALDWLLDSSIADALDLAVALIPYWQTRGLFDEGRETLDRLLAATADAPAPRRVRAMAAAGHLATFHGEIRQARGHLEQALALSRRVGDARSIAMVIAPLAECMRLTGDAAQAHALVAEGLALAELLGDRTLIPDFLFVDAGCSVVAGDFQSASPRFDRLVAASEEVGHTRMLAWGIMGQALVPMDRGSLDEASRLIDQGAELARSLDDPVSLGFAAWIRSLIALAEHRLADARALAVESIRHQLAAHIVYGLPYPFDTLALVDALEGNAERAARLLGAADSLRDRTGVAVPEPSKAPREAALGLMRAALSQAEIDAARAAGFAMSPDAALRLAAAPLEAGR